MDKAWTTPPVPCRAPTSDYTDGSINRAGRWSGSKAANPSVAM